MSDFDKAVERAQSRATILQNLQISHNKKKDQQAIASKQKQEAPVSQSVSTANATTIIVEAINDTSQKTKQFVSDMINGKQIVFETTVKSQADASKAELKAKM